MPSAFVISPFGEPYDAYWEEIFAPALRKAGLEPRRGDSMFASGNVVRQIWDMVLDAEIVLAELSEVNANVYYELGLAHAAGKPCILLTSDSASIPFDLRVQRHIVYDTIRPAWSTRLEEAIARAVQETVANPAGALVFPPSVALEVAADQVPDLATNLLMLQASVDSLRSQLQPGPLAPEFSADAALPSATVLRELASRLVEEGAAPERVVEQLRARGAPKLWAASLVEKLSTR